MFFPIITSETKLLPIYMTGIGCKEDQNHIIRLEGSESYQISYCETGEGVFKTCGLEYKIKPGMIFFYAPGVPHEYYSSKTPWKVHWVVFRGSCIPKILGDLGLKHHGAYDFSENKLVAEAFHELNIIKNSNNQSKELKYSSIIYQLLVDMGDYINYLSKSDNMKLLHRLSKVTSFMEQNSSGQPTLEEIAAVIGISPSHLCKLFKNVHNITPFQYLIKLRIQKAKLLLCQTQELSIKEVGQACGFNDISYFCSVFKEEEGVTPGVFKKIHGR